MLRLSRFQMSERGKCWQGFRFYLQEWRRFGPSIN